MNRLLSQARKCYYSEKIKECGKDQKSLFQVTRQLLGEAKDIKLITITQELKTAS